MTTANRSFEQSLSSMARGTSIILLGGVCGQVLGLATNVLMRRNFSVHEFGLISVALSVILFVQPIAELGFSGGVPRFIGYHRGRHENGAIRGVIYTGFLLTILAGLLCSAVIFFGADLIAGYMNEAGLAPSLRVMAFVAASLAIINVLLGIFRGFAQTQQKLFFDDLFPNIVKILILLVVIALGGSYLWVAGAYLLSVVAEVVLLTWYVQRNVLNPIAAEPIDWEAGKKMLRFSLPLMGSNHLSTVSRQTNLFLLVFFLSASDAALYSTAALVAPAIQVFYGAVRFIFLPVGSRLAGENKIDDFNKLYASVTKWVSACTLPLAAVLMVVPGPLLAFAFGEQYRPAALTTQLLVLGYLFSILVGPNTGALMALGHSGKVFWGLTIANISAIGLSFLLIPPFHILGAALAGMASLLISNVYLTVALYRINGTSPLSRGLSVVTLVVSVVTAALMPFSAQLERYPTLVVASLLGIVFFAVSLASAWLLGGIDAQDRQLGRMVRDTIRAKIGR